MKLVFVIASASPKEKQKSRGDGIRFMLEYHSVYPKFTGHLDIRPEDIYHIFFDSPSFDTLEFNTADSVKESLTQIILEDRIADLCVVYIGHGQRNGWALSGQRNRESLSYRDLGMIFVQHHGNLIFLNSACYGGMGSYAMKYHSGEHLFISPLPATRSGIVCDFFPALIYGWEKGKFFDPSISVGNNDSRPVVVGNPELQRLFFLKNPKPARGG